MAGRPLREVVDFLDGYFQVAAAVDYPNALNGLQVETSAAVRRVAVSVDCSEEVIVAAKDWADLLIVHHGLFWGGLQPITGRHYRRIEALIRSDTALYSVHLPLDAHPAIGNAALLARGLGLTNLRPFGAYKGSSAGWRGTFDKPMSVKDLAKTLSTFLGNPIVTLAGGPEEVSRVGVVTGAGGSTLEEAAALELDALVTGEAQHHHAIDAAEFGVTAFLGGHYATETLGVRSIAELLAEHFGIEGRFVDAPTGL